MQDFLDSFLKPTLDVDFDVLSLRVVLAVLVGLIVGLEREVSKHTDQEVVAGARTFALISLAGFVSFYLSYLVSSWILPLIFTAILAFSTLSYFVANRNGTTGSTTYITMILVFLMGGLVCIGKIRFAILNTVIILTLLSLKFEFKNIVGKIQHRDIFSLIEFVILFALVLPLLPNESYGYMGIFNPRALGIVVVLIVAINFFGYILSKFFGSHRGALFTGLIGGLFSSTAIAWSYSQKHFNRNELQASLASGVIAASSIMFLRVLFVLSVLNSHLLQHIALPFLLMTIAGMIASYSLAKKGSSDEVEPQLDSTNPLHVLGAMKFAMVFLVILYIARLSSEYFGNTGLLIASFISGLTDVDAISISIADLARSEPSIHLAHVAILTATLSNTLVKFGITMFVGRGKFRQYCAIGFSAILLTGIVCIGFAILSS